MLDSIPVLLAVGTVLGFLAGLGVGGGSLLILWLTFVMDKDPVTARGINLMFFLPSAIISCCFHWKHGQILWKKLFPAMAAGCISALLFSWLGSYFNIEVFRKAFGILLIFTGLRELFYRPRKFR